jgi:hypothetical protein
MQKSDMGILPLPLVSRELTKTPMGIRRPIVG